MNSVELTINNIKNPYFENENDIQTLDEYFNNYISKHYYKADKERNNYQSSLSSVYECLLSYSNYVLPKFLNSLHNEFEFNNVIYHMIIKYAPKSIKIHERLTKKYPNYTFHSLSIEEMNVIVGEAYDMYLIVQTFLDYLSEEEKNYINIVENLYEIACNEMQKNNEYFVSRIIYENSNQEYIKKYDVSPPKISFDKLYK